MANIGKTIQIFLPSGDPKGIKKAEIKTDKIEVIQSSRKDFLEKKDDFDFLGIYVLVDSLQEMKPKIYIGKGRVKERVYNHNDKKDFWNNVFAVRLKTEEGFNDSHISYLEHYFVDKAKKLKQSTTEENIQDPKCPKLEESIICELQCYIETIETLFSTLGLKVFQEIISDNKSSTKNRFYCTSTFGAYGEGEYTEDGFVVFKGAKCRKEYTDSARDNFSKKLVDDGILINDSNDNSLYLLTQDFKFSSPSLAGMTILARATNGWTTWKNKDNKTLDDVYRK